MKYLSPILLFLCLLPASTFAQQSTESKASSGSFYSYYGLGSPVSTAAAQEQAMGINGVSFNAYETPGLGNPAFWGNGAFSRGSASLDLGRYKSETNTAASKNNLFGIGTIQLVLPIIKWKLGLSAAAYPVTRSNFKSELLQTVYPTPTDTVRFQSIKDGSGGISKMELGLGYTINEYISIGYAPSIAFIRNNESETLLFLQGVYTSNFVNTKISGSSLSHRFGLLVSKPTLFNRGDLLQFGATVTLPATFKTTSEATTTKELQDSQKEVELAKVENAKISLPLQISTGFTYFSRTYLNFSVEGAYEQWSRAIYDLDKTQENSFKDRITIGAGAQYHPYRSGSEAFLSRFKYSAGISYDDGYLNVAGKDISTFWLSAGIGVISPMMSRSSFDLSIRYGLRGTKEMNLIQEKVWLIGLTVNLTELMFNRPKLN